MTVTGPADDRAIATDALIVGAGPVGLFQVFELGLLEIGAQVVDSLAEAGGQCIALYPDKPIYDIPGTPLCTGRELIAQLSRQIAPFGAGFHFDQEVSTVERRADGGFRVVTSAGTTFLAKTIFIAGGVGSFQARRLKVDGLAAHEGRQVFHRIDDPARLVAQRVVIVGDDDPALLLAIALAEDGPQRASQVTLMHRRDSFKAAPASVARLQALRDAGALRFVAGQVRGIEVQGDRLTALRIDAPEGGEQRLPLDRLVVLMGLSPKLGPIADWGLDLERKQVVVDPSTFETSVAGIFAVGDVVTYPGKKKLILSGFHEAALAAFGALPRVHPDRPGHLEYTTTSPRLHRLLGVASPAEPA